MEEKKMKEVTKKTCRNVYSEITEKAKCAFGFRFNLSFHSLKNQEFVDMSYMRYSQHNENVNYQKFFSVQFSCLSEFISQFIYFPRVQEIIIDCSEALIARVILSIARAHEKLTPLIDCTDYFIRKEGIYQILSNTFLFDAFEDWKGIEDKIHSLKVKIHSHIFDQTLVALNTFNELRSVECQIGSLIEVSKQTNLLIQLLGSKSKNLEKLTLEVYLEELLPAICTKNFQNEVEVQIIYVYQLLKMVDPIKALNYVGTLTSMKRTFLKIPDFVELNENEIKVSLYHQLLSKNIEPEKDELVALLRCLDHSIQQQEKITLTFNPDQKMNLKRFAGFSKLLCSKTSLKIVELQLPSISKQISALSLCKLVKSGKVTAFVNSQSFKNGILEYWI